MQRHVGSAGSVAATIVAAALAFTQCSREEAKPEDGREPAVEASAARKPAAEPSPFSLVVLSAATDSFGYAQELRGKELGTACRPTATYFALRRAIARGKTMFRKQVPEATEVLLGPASPTVEGGGNLGLLDVALVEGDCEAARKAAYQVEQALRLIELSIRMNPGSWEAVRAQLARSLSEVAVGLGEILLESHAEVGVTEEGVLADAEGALDAVNEGLVALAPGSAGLTHLTMFTAQARGHVGTLHAALATAKSKGLTDRGTLVLETGKLGVVLRQVARELDIDLAPPFRPRVPTTEDPIEEPVNALTVPAARGALNLKLADLGKRLFRDRRLSAGQKRSCASCHDPQRAFSDGLVRAPTLAHGVTLRNTPTLLYAAAQAAQLWDGRLVTSERQALRVMKSEAEMGVSEEDLVRDLGRDAETVSAFERLFADGVTAKNVAQALSEYQRAELVPATAPIDRFARGDESALTKAERAGLDVFAGPGRCARCHVPPLFGGTRPNDFSVTVYAAIGTTSAPDGKALDSDLGRGAITKNPLDERSFKTPTVRNVARTAPFFHNGAFPTLESVVDFYDRGGGRAFGHDVPNQDPEVRPLKLTTAQRRALLSFLGRPLSDGVPPR